MRRPRCLSCGKPLIALSAQVKTAGHGTWDRRPWGECKRCMLVFMVEGSKSYNPAATARRVADAAAWCIRAGAIEDALKILESGRVPKDVREQMTMTKEVKHDRSDCETAGEAPAEPGDPDHS